MADSAILATKLCPRCKVEKAIVEFGKNVTTGVQGYCKVCNNEQGKIAYRNKNPGKCRPKNIDFQNKTRLCLGCFVVKPWEKFDIHKTKGIPHSRCNECRTLAHKEKKLKNPSLYLSIERKSKLKNCYGMTVQEYEAMLVGQDFKCKICKSETSGRKSGVFLVDHNHTTGVVRGLLCSKCNSALGMFGDSPIRLQLAALYVEKEGNI